MINKFLIILITFENLRLINVLIIIIRHNLCSSTSLISGTFQIFLGLVMDEDQSPIEGARIIVENIKHDIVTSSRGEYWRLLIPGIYKISAEAHGYRRSQVKTVIVNETTPTIVNFTLQIQPYDGRNRYWLRYKTNFFSVFGFLTFNMTWGISVGNVWGILV